MKTITKIRKIAKSLYESDDKEILFIHPIIVGDWTCVETSKGKWEWKYVDIEIDSIHFYKGSPRLGNRTYGYNLGDIKEEDLVKILTLLENKSYSILIKGKTWLPLNS